jgi:predicted O-methyltransferase YrrM
MTIKRYFNIKAYPRFAVVVIKRVYRPITRSVRTRADVRRLRQSIPGLGNFNELARQSRRELRPYYREYVTKVSRADLAISLELAVFLSVMCHVLKPRSILDLGSGFSSLAFRLAVMKEALNTVICSVDDSPEWLDKTRAFLAAHGVPAGNLVDWRSFVEQEHGTFDLILHDLGSIHTRASTFNQVLGRAHRGTVIILDDMHLAEYSLPVERMLRQSNLTYFDLRRYTEDRFGRYSTLVIL